jgi:hypothetical protein
MRILADKVGKVRGRHCGLKPTLLRSGGHKGESWIFSITQDSADAFDL